jgi:virginiamycin B lyase
MRTSKLVNWALEGLALVALAACTGNAVRSPSASFSLPFVRSAGQAEPAHQPRFLHEYQLPLGTYPSSIVAGSDGAMWFGDYPAFTYHQPINLGVGRITLTGKQHYYVFGRGVYDVAEGGDGKVWFTEAYGYGPHHRIGSIATNGTRKEYRVQSQGEPESIAADASQHLWYTAFGGNPDIIEITTNGKTVGRFKAAAGFADKVAYGASGRIWFNAIANPVVVGLITHHGGQRYGPIGGPNYVPGPMALGPDGRMWICDGNMLAAVDGSLTVSRYALPSGGNFADVAAGPDGNLWATDFINSAIVRVTITGVMTEYKTPPPSLVPSAITVGPDHNIWFTEMQPKTDVVKIGVLKP